MEYKNIFVNGRDRIKAARVMSLVDEQNKNSIVDMIGDIDGSIAFVKLTNISMEIEHIGTKVSETYSGDLSNRAIFSCKRTPAADLYNLKGNMEICSKYKDFMEFQKSHYINPFTTLSDELKKTTNYNVVVFI